MAGEDKADGPALANSVALLLVTAGRVLTRRVEDELAAHGLTLRHLGALGPLASRPDLSYSDLARRGGITTQSRHARGGALGERGAFRRTLPGHGHAASLEITEQGRELLAEAGRATSRLDGELLARLTDEQRTG